MTEQQEGGLFDPARASKCLSDFNIQSLPLQKHWSAGDAMNMSDTSITSADHNFRGTAFHGSFAPFSQKRKGIHKKPWYRRREYFTEGWLDTHIWRAGVSIISNHTLKGSSNGDVLREI